MLSLPNLSFKPPRFSFRFFIFSLFALVVLVLAAEGGYYFWIQKKMGKQQPPFTVRQEGIFTYIKVNIKARGEVHQKQIWGTVEEINENELTIKTESGEEVKVEYNNKKIWIARKFVDEATVDAFIEGDLSRVFLGDEVRIDQIETDSQGKLSAGYLVVIR